MPFVSLLFTITNTTAHFYSAEDINHIREYVRARASSHILSALIGEVAVLCDCAYGEQWFKLADIFCANAKPSHGGTSESEDPEGWTSQVFTNSSLD